MILGFKKRMLQGITPLGRVFKILNFEHPYLRANSLSHTNDIPHN